MKNHRYSEVKHAVFVFMAQCVFFCGVYVACSMWKYLYRTIFGLDCFSGRCVGFRTWMVVSGYKSAKI